MSTPTRKPSPRPRHARPEVVEDGEAGAADAVTWSDGGALQTRPAGPVEHTTAADAQPEHTRARRHRHRYCQTSGCTPRTPATHPAEAPAQCAAHYDSRRGDVIDAAAHRSQED